MQHVLKKVNDAICLLSILCITACQQQLPTTIRTGGSLTLVDSTTIPVGARYSPFEGWTNGAYYPIFYMGKIADTILLGKSSIPHFIQQIDDTIVSIDGYAKVKAAIPDSTNMKIVVDTTLILSYARRYYDDNYREVPDSTQYSQSFAVLIYNTGKDPIHIAMFSELLHTIRQFKDSAGNWVDYENRIMYGCGTGSQEKYIPPGHMLVAKAIREKGDVKVVCRLKHTRFGSEVYSNSYMDYIDLASFTRWKRIPTMPMPPPIPHLQASEQ
jgi:hypothetical protein